jgi:Peptidase family M1 domain
MAPPELPLSLATPTPSSAALQPTQAPPSQPAAVEPAQLRLPACSFEEGQAPRVASYCMSVRLDPETKTVAGIERIAYHNPSQDTLNEVWLRLYLRAFRDRDTLWMRESGGQLRGDLADPNALGDITISRLALVDGTDLLASATLTDTLLRVPLPQLLAPGQSLDLDVSWTSKLPRVFARTGYGGRDDTFFMVGQWYPKLAVYDRGRWDTEPWHANAEFFNDFGGYDVTIATPKKYVVAGVGAPKGDAAEQAGVKTVRYTASDVTDFAFAASPDFKVETRKAGDVEVVLYSLPEHQSSVAEYMESATGSLQAYSDWYGAYPHPRLTVVDVPESAGGAGGMEYPTLVTGGTFGEPPNSGIVTLVVSHEVGHQWWPMQTATNESREPWLDEGITEYSGIRYMAEAGRTIKSGGVPLDAHTFEMMQYGQVRKPATMPSSRYTTSEYGSAVYSKTALGLWTLESVVGTARFRRAMADYLAQYRFKHPTGADFRRALERSLGDESWFFDDYMNSTGVIEYVAAPIETTAGGSIVHVRRDGAVRAPVETRITLADGTEQIKTWDGQAEETSFTFPASNPVKKVEVDPEDKLKAEKDRLNNTTSAAP